MTSLYSMKHSDLQYESQQFRQFAVLKKEAMKAIMDADIATAKVVVPCHTFLSGHAGTCQPVPSACVFRCQSASFEEAGHLLCYSLLCLFCFAVFHLQLRFSHKLCNWEGIHSCMSHHSYFSDKFFTAKPELGADPLS